MVGEIDWFVKSYWYAAVCISDDFNGTATIWKTEEEAWNDVEERIEAFFDDDNERNRFYSKKVKDGYEIREKSNDKIIRCYKIFDTQELEPWVNLQ